MNTTPQAKNPILVTGGAGFVGSHFVKKALNNGHRIVTMDHVEPTGPLNTLKEIWTHKNHQYIQGTIQDGALLQRLLANHRPKAIVNFATITDDSRELGKVPDFMTTNVIGTRTLLDAALVHWRLLSPRKRKTFRFLQVSTTEVFGTLDRNSPINEQSTYAPISPYVASRAAADHLVDAWNKTYGLPTLLSHCAPNYGPFQQGEALLPGALRFALAGKPQPLALEGQKTDWIHVQDHCEALLLLLAAAKPGQHYCLGGGAAKSNRDVLEQLCNTLDQLLPRKGRRSFRFEGQKKSSTANKIISQHSIDTSKIHKELGWVPSRTFEDGIRETMSWYLERPEFWQAQQSFAAAS